jgi:spore coat protein U-like protein
MPRRGKIPGLLLVLAMSTVTAAPLPVAAGSDTDQLMVTVTVQSGCRLNGGTLDFGSYNSGQPTDLDAVGIINIVDCNGDIVISLDGGGSGAVTNRQMRSGDNRLNYQLYRNPTRTAIWGEGSDAREITLLALQSAPIQVYARIPKSQTVPDGVYTDVVNITLSF